jgi:hypothetical protein
MSVPKRRTPSRWTLLHTATFLSIDCGQSIWKSRGYVYKNWQKQRTWTQKKLNGWIKKVAAEGRDIISTHAVFTYGECDKL